MNHMTMCTDLLNSKTRMNVLLRNDTPATWWGKAYAHLQRSKCVYHSNESCIFNQARTHFDISKTGQVSTSKTRCTAAAILTLHTSHTKAMKEIY